MPRSSTRDGASLVQRHAAAPTKPAGQLLLSILMLEVWLTTFLPRAADVRPRSTSAVS